MLFSDTHWIIAQLTTTPMVQSGGAAYENPLTTARRMSCRISPLNGKKRLAEALNVMLLEAQSAGQRP
jgi:hypothetical protein